MKVFITGSSSGLGHALASYYLAEGDEVYGLSRSVPENAADYTFCSCDIADTDAVETALDELFKGMDSLDLVYLNAGTLGRIQDTSACTLEELKQQMDINLWANKVILDYLIHNNIEVAEVIAISSGASVSGSLGWNGYSLSKAALNMLMKLYANEMKKTHIIALAPGLIETPMLGSIIYGDHDTKRYDSVQRLRDSKEHGLVRSPDECAKLIDTSREKLRKLESGSFTDIRLLD